MPRALRSTRFTSLNKQRVSLFKFKKKKEPVSQAEITSAERSHSLHQPGGFEARRPLIWKFPPGAKPIPSLRPRRDPPATIRSQASAQPVPTGSGPTPTPEPGHQCRSPRAQTGWITWGGGIVLGRRHHSLHINLLWEEHCDYF